MIALRLVPKVLYAVTHIWAPNAYIISFKLETDNGILEQKAKGALTKYKHQVSLNNYFIININLSIIMSKLII
jgi:phosphopantothenate---cysteine ligase (ATP)